MSDKFHINASGNAGKCSAKQGGCPFGDESQHHATAEAARAQFEADNSKDIPKVSKKSKVSKNKIEPVEPTVENGYTEKVDSDGNVTQRVRLVNKRPDDHPTGTPAVIKYREHSIEEIHYHAGKIHDGSGDTPSKIMRVISGPNEGSVIIERGFQYRGKNRSKDNQFRGQDPLDRQPGRIHTRKDGSKTVSHLTDGIRQDPEDGSHAYIVTSANGAVTKHHMNRGLQQDSIKGDPAVTVYRPDGSIEKTVRYFHGRPWDGPNGEPAIIEYDKEGKVEKTTYATLGVSSDESRYITLYSDTPLENSIPRNSVSWMQQKPLQRYIEAD